jgi:hypothetical protein
MDQQMYVLLSDIRTLLRELVEVEREELRIARILTGIDKNLPNLNEQVIPEED